MYETNQVCKIDIDSKTIGHHVAVSINMPNRVVQSTEGTLFMTLFDGCFGSKPCTPGGFPIIVGYDPSLLIGYYDVPYHFPMIVAYFPMYPWCVPSLLMVNKC